MRPYFASSRTSRRSRSASKLPSAPATAWIPGGSPDRCPPRSFALARPPGVLFFLGLRRGTYPLFGIIDACLFLVQGPLLFLAAREHDEAAAALAAREHDEAVGS